MRSVLGPLDAVAAAIAHEYARSAFEALELFAWASLLRVAVIGLHETAHAVVAMAGGIRVVEVSVGWNYGHCTLDAERVPLSHMTLSILAGPGSGILLCYCVMLSPLPDFIGWSLALFGLLTALPEFGSGSDWSKAYWHLAMAVPLELSPEELEHFRQQELTRAREAAQ